MSKGSARVAELVDQLAAVELRNVFNPYRDVCEFHDDGESPAVRRKNLQRYIEGALSRQLTTAWIGRDLGYRGGRRTGLPLTDEAHLRAFIRSFQVKGEVAKATTTEVVAERTAAEIWRVLQELDEPPFLWNAFPLHPHDGQDEMSNRCHSRREFEACEPILRALLDLFKFEKVYALGNDAARAMITLGVDCQVIRHPSYGGQTEFRRRVADEYGRPVRRQEELAI